MNEREVEAMNKLLKGSLTPVGDAQGPRDLWPAMQRKLSERTVRVPWWDWVLLAGASLMLWFFPGLLPALLYHL